MKHLKAITEAYKLDTNASRETVQRAVGDSLAVKRIEDAMNLHLKFFIENLVNEFHDCKHWEIVGFVKADLKNCGEEKECAVENKGGKSERQYDAQEPETVNGIIEKMYVWQTDTAVSGESVGAALIPFTHGLFIKVAFSYSARSH